VGKPVVERFTEYLAAERNASEETVRGYRREVELLQRFLRDDGNVGDAEPVDWSKVTAVPHRARGLGEQGYRFSDFSEEPQAVFPGAVEDPISLRRGADDQDDERRRRRADQRVVEPRLDDAGIGQVQGALLRLLRAAPGALCGKTRGGPADPSLIVGQPRVGERRHPGPFSGERLVQAVVH